MDMTNASEYNSIKEVPPFSIIESLDKEYAKKVLTTLVKKFKASELQDHWRLQKDTYYARLNKYNVEVNPHSGGRVTPDIPITEPQFEALLKMPFDKAKAEIQRMKDTYGSGKIQEYWNISAYTFKKDIIQKYDIEVEKRSPRSDKGVKKTEVVKKDTITTYKTQTAPIQNTSIQVTPIPQQIQYVSAPVQQEEEFEGFRIGFKGTFEGDKLVKRLEGLLMTMTEGCKYKINLEVIELESKEESKDVDTTVTNTVLP